MVWSEEAGIGDGLVSHLLIVRANKNRVNVPFGCFMVYTASPEALRLRLEDPSSVKSDTQMPNLDLKEAEIEALIAFINSK